MTLLLLIALAVGGVLLTQNEQFMDEIAKIVDGLFKMYKASLHRKHQEWLSQHPEKHFQIEQTFRAQTLVGFDLEYSMTLVCERIDLDQSIREQVLNPVVTEIIAYDFRDKVFEPHFNDRSYFWHLDPFSVPALGVSTMIAEVAKEEGREVVQAVRKERLKAEMILLPPLKCRGCEIRLLDFSIPALPDELIERNYQVLSEEQKEEITKSAEFGVAAEMLAVSLLKERLNLLRGGSQNYTAGTFTLETEKVGRSFKIKWKLTTGASSHFLLGFRNNGGFSKDQWSEDANGVRVIDASADGEVVEVLQDGVSYFYTFFLKPFHESEHVLRNSLLRFQITIESRAEMEAIEATLKKIEEKQKPEPEKENLSKALKEIGSYVEMDHALDALGESFAEGIRKSDRPEAEKQKKIERLEDFVRIVRSKYEP